MSRESSRVDALIEGSDRSSRRPHTSRDVLQEMESAMADALRDILQDEGRDEVRRDAIRRG